MKELFKIHIDLQDVFEVQGNGGTAKMLLFNGRVASELFTGVVLPGAVDTQIRKRGEKNTLSARYILDGVDGCGEKCQIFIQNDGIDLENGECIKTTPFLLTNSENLKWIETSNVKGEVLGEKDGIVIRLYVEDCEELIVMEKLFKLSPKELAKVSIEAEFDEEHNLIRREENCIHRNGIIIFKQPIHVLYEDFMCEITDVKAIIKDDSDSKFVYMFAMTEVKSEKNLNALCDFFELENGSQNGCYGINTHSKGWKFGNRICEVNEEM